jgi:hypothetical protein
MTMLRHISVSSGGIYTMPPTVERQTFVLCAQAQPKLMLFYRSVNIWVRVKSFALGRSDDEAGRRKTGEFRFYINTHEE